MARRPVLTNYPHLHHILKNDPVANQQLNSVLNEVSDSLLRSDAVGASNVEQAQQLAELTTKYHELLSFARRAKSLLRKFSEVLEPQVKLTPYSEDITDGKEYSINFSAVQIRRVLALHWEVVAQRTEDLIAGRPVDAVEEDDET